MNGNIDFSGSLSGSILDSGSGGVQDVLVRNAQTSDYVSVVDEEQNAKIDLVSYVRRNELTQELNALEENIDITKQDRLTAGTGIDITNNVISTVGGSGGKMQELARANQYWGANTNVFLNDEISNYDLLLFIVVYRSSYDRTFFPSAIIPVADFKKSILDRFYMYYADNNYCDVKYVNETTINFLRVAGTFHPQAVYGIKL